MLKILAVAAALLAPSVALAQTQTPAATEPIQVMIVGSFHFDNPGRDLNNLPVDPVTTPRKQAELAAVAEGLRRFRPTAVAIEREAPDKATLLDQGYPAFTTAALLTNPDERVQVAYRLANLEGLSRVYAIDEKTREGRRDYFPIDTVATWVAAHNREAELAALRGPVTAYIAQMIADQKTHTLGQMLADTNRVDNPIFGRLDFYYGLMQFDDGLEQPGAELNAAWFERNARIFAKLSSVAKPGDRIVVVFGAGHAFWLRQLVQMSPGYVLVDPAPYLAGT